MSSIQHWSAVLAGIGGQGILSAARFLALAAHRQGLPVVAGQLHGMAQRGGSVMGTVVIGSQSSIVPDGTADVLVATEPGEAVRAAPYLRPDGLVLVATRPLLPIGLARERGTYPAVADLLAALRARAGRVIAIDAAELATRAGSPRVLNVVMLAVLAGSKRCPIEPERLLAVIEEASAPLSRLVNRRAFELGQAEA